MPQKWRPAAAFLVFLAALFALGFNLRNVGIASGFVDPVTRLGAQDEALYTREAIHMATGGGWLTPVYLGRFVLFKPPLLMGLSGISMTLFGVEPLAARIPALLSGAWICLMVFGIAWRARSMLAAIAAVLLLVSNQLFHTMARVNMTDILLTACVASAFAFWLRDPAMKDRGAFWGFSASVAAAILTKSVAGLLPLIAVALCRRLSITRFFQVCLPIAAITLPWHLYQLFVHRDWFLAEYLGVQLVVFGSRPPQTSQENQLWFYVRRLVASDSVLLLLFATSLAGMWRARQNEKVLLLSWIAVFGGALFAFQYRSWQYALPLIPALALAGAIYSPLLTRKAAPFTISLLAIAFAVKAWSPASTPAGNWNLSFASGSTLVSADPLSDYCARRRAAELIVLLPDDEFYSSVLPLPRVRYSWIDTTGESAAREPHLRYLGITLTPAQFESLPRDRDEYLRRLKSWGLTGSDPTGTAIVARNVDEMRAMILSHPGSDFFLPRFLLAGGIGDHAIVEATPNRVFLLAIHPPEVSPPAVTWTCDM